MIEVSKIMPLKKEFKLVSSKDLVKSILDKKIPRMKDKGVFK
jgi:hypothetical protein